MMKKIFRQNALIAIGYTVVLFGISFLFSRYSQSTLAITLYVVFGGIHFMIMGVLMAINHFQSKLAERNGYMASFAFIWVLIIVASSAELFIR
jgi:hypothetical protein